MSTSTGHGNGEASETKQPTKTGESLKRHFLDLNSFANGVASGWLVDPLAGVHLQSPSDPEKMVGQAPMGSFTNF